MSGREGSRATPTSLGNGLASPGPEMHSGVTDSLDDRAGLAARPLERVLEEFRSEGYARVGVLCDAATLDGLRQRLTEIMLGEVRYEGMFFQLDTTTGQYEDLDFGKGYQGPSLNYRKIEKLERDPLFLRWVENPDFATIARTLIAEEIVLYRALVFNKSAETGGSALPWHQDGGRFWGLDREPTLQVWTALDDVPIDGGCLEVVPGSHKAGLATPLGGVVPKNLVDDSNAEGRARKVPAVAGEVILIHNQLWHRSQRSQTGRPRRALTVCYMDAKTKCLRTKRAPRTFVPVFADRTPSRG